MRPVALLILMSFIGLAVSSPYQIRKCRGSNVKAGEVLSIPSYYFEEDVRLRISAKELSGCSSKDETFETAEYIFLSEDELESFYLPDLFDYVTIVPNGYLAVERNFYLPEEYCVQEYSDKGTRSLQSLTFKYCKYDCTNNLTRIASQRTNRPCINSCCPMGASFDINNGRCAPSIEGGQDWMGFFYVKESEESIGHHYQFQPRYWYYRLDCKLNDTEIWVNHIGGEDNIKIKLLTDGSLRFVSGRRRWETINDFCIGGSQNYGQNKTIFIPYEGDELDQIVGLCSNEIKVKEKAQSTLYMYSLFIASVVYLMTALFLGLLWNHQNINGRSVFFMCCCLSMMTFLLGNAHRFGLAGDYTIRGSVGCIVNGIIAHYFYIASFTWLAVISFNVWSAFRVLKVRNDDDSKKLYYYMLVGFGCPLIVVIVGYTLQKIYPNSDSLVIVPEYGKNLCFVDEYAQGVYIFYILAVPFSIILILFIHTVYKLYTFQQDTAKARSSSSARDRKMIQLFMKLSIVLGISWIFELLSWLLTRSETSQNWVWVIFDMYNLFSSVFVFYIFVLKKKTVTQLEANFPFMKPVTTKISNVWTSEKLSSQEHSGNTNSSNLQNSQKLEMGSSKKSDVSGYSCKNKDYQ